MVTICTAVVLAVAGCTSSPPAPRRTNTIVTDCMGHMTSIDRPPRRVVTLTSSVLEMLFWLGAEDLVVGTGTPPSPGDFPRRYESEAFRIPRLSDAYKAGAYTPVPAKTLLGAEPDLVVGGFPSNFMSSGALGQQELAAQGIASYLAFSTACPDENVGPQNDLTLVHRDLLNLGKLLGMERRANRLVADMKAKENAAAAKVKGAKRPSVFAFEYNEGTRRPVVAGNRQTINAVIRMAGGMNAFADVNTAYQDMDWARVRKRDPDVILVIVYAMSTSEETREEFQKAERFLRTSPATRTMRAVRKRSFVRLVYEQGSVGGVRNANAVTALAEGLHPERY
ncbi:MAG: ABC transporter substrate-binding protein [Streptosporangiales bacterium]|nr:ABC transporter substrate-binding protein [Streptosporangiales bacterium]